MNPFRFSKIISLAILIVVFLSSTFLVPDSFPNFRIFAQENLEEICQWEKIKEKPKNFSKEDYESLLRKCQTYYQKKSEEIEGDITKTKQEKDTLENKIYILSNKIKSLDYQIYQGNIIIKDLSVQIGDTEKSIKETSLNIDQVKERLSLLLQLRYEEDQKSLLEIFLAEEDLSDFFDNLMALESLNKETQSLLGDVKELKTSLEGQKESMDKEKKELENSVAIQTFQKQESAESKKEQEYFLKLTEEEYQRYLRKKKEAEETVTKIGNLLFELIEVPEGGIKFEDAVRIAKDISRQTGIRAAFSLAVLWQETKIGQLKGGCFLKNEMTGDGIYIKTGNTAPRTMNPTRDVPPFLNIIKELNKTKKLETDAFHTPVSCCMITTTGFFGWGGAMGPAQFIPSTWMLYKELIEKNTGNVPANPWNVRDAFLANALYLRDLGAASQTYEKEIYAALRYFGCTSSWCRQYYGQPVMTVAGCIQDYIDKGSMSTACKDLVF